jgi:hypothetical protein
MTEPIRDDKYIVFHRDEFLEHLGNASGFQHLVVKDAVVIRRQDKIASPALATYASMIAIAASLTTDEEARKGLLKVADYFEDQARAAADEGHKLPD